jgi:hypothetical protein
MPHSLFSRTAVHVIEFISSLSLTHDALVCMIYAHYNILL